MKKIVQITEISRNFFLQRIACFFQCKLRVCVLVSKIQSNVPANVNGYRWASRIEVRQHINDMLYGRLPGNDGEVYNLLLNCVQGHFVEELQLAVRLPRSPVEYPYTFICLDSPTIVVF